MQRSVHRLLSPLPRSPLGSACFPPAAAFRGRSTPSCCFSSSQPVSFQGAGSPSVSRPSSRSLIASSKPLRLNRSDRRTLASASPNMPSSTWTPPAPDAVPAPPPSKPNDRHTLSNIQDIYSKHIHIDWSIDWDARIISGSVTHELVVDTDGVKEVVLDTSYLDIKHVEVEGEKVQFKLDERKGMLGSALHIPLKHADKLRKGDKVSVKVGYSTTPQCTSLGWLTAESVKRLSSCSKPTDDLPLFHQSNRSKESSVPLLPVAGDPWALAPPMHGLPSTKDNLHLLRQISHPRSHVRPSDTQRSIRHTRLDVQCSERIHF